MMFPARVYTRVALVFSVAALPATGCSPVPATANVAVSRAAKPSKEVVDLLKWSSDGNFLIVGSHQGDASNIKVWSFPFGTLVHSWSVKGSIRDLEVSPKSNVLLLSIVGAPQTRSLQIWDWRRVQHLRDVSFEGGVQATTFAPDGKSFIVAGTNQMMAFDTTTGRSIRTFQAKRSTPYGRDVPLMIERVAISPDGRYVLATEDDIALAIGVWDFKSGKYIKGLVRGFGWFLLQSADGKRLIYSSEDTWHVVNFPQGKEVAQFDGIGSWASASLTPDGQWLATTGDGLYLTSLRTRKSFESIPVDGPIAFSPSGRYLACFIPKHSEPQFKSLQELISTVPRGHGDDKA